MTSTRSFTLLELAVAILVIAIVVVVSLPLMAKYRARAQRVQCTGNLKSLHVAAQLFVQEHEQWPQIRLSANDDTGWEGFAVRWREALAPYGAVPKTWICPTRQHLMNNPDYTKATHARIDYIPTPFDDKPATPQIIGAHVPWFSEAGDFHGNGNLLIFADGAVVDLKTATTRAQSPAP